MVAASILDAFWMTHLHYCQRTTANENWFLRPAGYDLETDWKRDKWLNGKALNRTAREADQNSLCQLGKMAVVKASSKHKALTDFQSQPRRWASADSNTSTASRRFVLRRLMGVGMVYETIR